MGAAFAEVVGVECLSVMVGGPKAPGGLVGECDGGFVVSDAVGQGDRPGLRAIEDSALLEDAPGGGECGSGAMDEQGAQVAVALLGDAAEASGIAAGVLAGREAEGAGEVTSGIEAGEFAEACAESGGGDQADTGSLLVALAADVAPGKGLQLAFDVLHAGFAERDLVEQVAEAVAQGHRQIVVGVFQGSQGGGSHTLGTRRDGDAEFPEQAADQVDVGGALGFEVLADAVHSLDALLIGGLDGHRVDIGAAVGFKEAGGIGAVGLVAAHIGSHVVGGQQQRLMADALEASRPIVGRATSFHDDAKRRAIVEAAREGTATETFALDDSVIGIGEREFEDILGKVDGHAHDGRVRGGLAIGSNIHGGLLERDKLSLAQRSRVATPGESIRSFKPTADRALRSNQLPRRGLVRR